MLICTAPHWHVIDAILSADVRARRPSDNNAGAATSWRRRGDVRRRLAADWRRCSLQRGTRTSVSVSQRPQCDPFVSTVIGDR